MSLDPHPPPPHIALLTAVHTPFIVNSLVGIETMSHVTMLLSNAFRPDPRVGREAKALAQAGHQVTIICWDRQAEMPLQETMDGYQVIRVQNVRTTYGAGVRQILCTPRFWRAAAQQVLDLHPDVIHCHDLDTLPAGWWLKQRTDARLIYDAHEDYPAMMSLYLPMTLVHTLSWLERRLLRRVDATITASTIFANKLRAQGTAAPVVTVGNFQDLEPFNAVPPEAIAAARARLNLKPATCTVAYIGGFSRNRLLLPLIEAAHELPEVTFLLWGDGHQRAEIEVAAAQIPNVHYLGWLPADQVPLSMKAVDVIYYCLRPDYPGAIYNAPNTLSHAMAAGRPIIANDVGDLGRIVRKTECGLLLNEVTPDTITAAIRKLSDPTYRQQLGAAGRAAAERQYNWTSASSLLREVYAQLTKEIT